MKKRALYLILPIITLILEFLPYGAVCIFAPSPTERVKETFSYFDPIPFGYANFAPLLTAILTCLLFVLLTVFLATGNIKSANSAKVILLIAVILSLAPLCFGIEYFTLVALFVTLSLAAELLLLHFTFNKN